MSTHTTARLISAGRGILATEDGLAVFTAHGPDLDANEARLIAIWNNHDQLIAESVTLRDDLNVARTNWEAAAEELRLTDPVREQLVAALKKAEIDLTAAYVELGHRTTPRPVLDIRAALTAAGAV